MSRYAFRSQSVEQVYPEPPPRCGKCLHSLDQLRCRMCSIRKLVLAAPQDRPLRRTISTATTWEKGGAR